MRKIIFAILALFFASSVWGQTVTEHWIANDTLQIFFKQGKHHLDTAYKNNGMSLEGFKERFNSCMEQPRKRVMSAAIVSGASPEGPAALNRLLSDLRAKALYDYLLSHNLVDSSKVEIESRGVDWKGLEEQMLSSEYEGKEDVIELIRNGGDRLASLKGLAGGKVWRDIYNTYFPDLRGTMFTVSWSVKKDIHNLGSVAALQPETFCETKVQNGLSFDYGLNEEQDEKRHFRMVLKSNLLYDAMLIPNIGIELGLWKGLALNVEYMHNIWLQYDNRDFSKRHWYRVHGAEFGLKYYINREHRPFAKGHHVGLSGQMLTFDVTGTLADADPWKGGIMATYGYVLPVGKRLNLDFEIGAGYLTGDVHKYDVVKESDDVYKRIYRKTNNGAFIPKLGVTLQYLIGKNNYNERRK